MIGGQRAFVNVELCNGPLLLLVRGYHVLLLHMRVSRHHSTVNTRVAHRQLKLRPMCSLTVTLQGVGLAGPVMNVTQAAGTSGTGASYCIDVLQFRYRYVS